MNSLAGWAPMLAKLLCNMLSLQGKVLSLLKAHQRKDRPGTTAESSVIWELLQGMALIS